MRFCLLLGCALVACTSTHPNEPANATGRPSTAPAGSGWTAGAAVVESGSVAGRGDFNRLIRYTRAAGTLEIKDSDPFASGSEAKTPRVLNLSRVLSPEERQRVETILSRVNPDEAALGRRCAPGGCIWLERIDTGGSRQRLEHHESVQPVLSDLSAFFGEVRRF